MESCAYAITVSNPGGNITVCVIGSTSANLKVLMMCSMIIAMIAITALFIQVVLLWYHLMKSVKRNSTHRRLDSSNVKISRVCNEDSTKIIIELPRRDGNLSKYPENDDECKQIVISQIQKELEQQWETN